MIEAILVVLSNAREGREDDFNDWYTNVHIRDALRFRGSMATQRFVLSSGQVQDFPEGRFFAKYLALYEVYDAQRFAQEHFDNALTPRMVVTDAFDDTRLDDYHYYPLQFRDNAPRTDAKGSVVLELFNAAPGQDQALREWYNDSYMPGVMKRPGVVSGNFLAYDRHGQLMNHKPDHNYVAIYRLSDDAARASWKASTALAECPHIAAESLAVTCWDIITPRLTEDDVAHTSAAALAREERARAHIGDNYIKDRGDKLAG